MIPRSQKNVTKFLSASRFVVSVYTLKAHRTDSARTCFKNTSFFSLLTRFTPYAYLASIPTFQWKTQVSPFFRFIIQTFFEFSSLKFLKALFPIVFVLHYSYVKNMFKFVLICTLDNPSILLHPLN